jgi:hypothetical protein
LDNVIEVNPFSAASFFIEMMFNEENIACGTAFYFLLQGNTYLVSNWHNFSGRHPESHQPLHSQLAIPNRIRVHGHDVDNLGVSAISTYELSDSDGACLWYQHPRLGSSIDVGVLPIPNNRDANTFDILAAVNEVDPFDDWRLEIGEQLFVLGFPFGISDTYRFPIWKSASLASEPAIDQENLPLLYVDTATSPGMSGSPVIKYQRRAVSIFDKDRHSRFHAAFIGIYSGRIVPKNQIEAQLGRVWKADCIEEIIRGAVQPNI